MVKKWVKGVVLLSMLSVFTVASAGAETVSVGHLVDFTGPTGGVGAHYGPGVIDALNYVNKKYVKVDEQAAVDDLAATLPFGDDYRALVAEFSEQQSREAQLAHDADQLEMILALKEYKDLGNRYADEWYPFSVRRLKTDTAKRLAESIWSTDSSRWWFDDDEDWWVKGRR